MSLKFHFPLIVLAATVLLTHVSLMLSTLKLVYFTTALLEIYIFFSFAPDVKNASWLHIALHFTTQPVSWVSLAPRKTYHKTQFSQRIISLSSNFVKLYRQSERAELDGLDEICGMGYRKALEFLVKDFAIHEHPDNTKEIIKLPLSQCITDYIDSEKNPRPCKSFRLAWK